MHHEYGRLTLATAGSCLHNVRYKLNVRYLLEILALQIAAKQLQLATWLLLTAYIGTYQRPIQRHAPSPTLCDVPFSHNTKRYRQTTDRQTTDGQNIVYHKHDRTTQYGRLKTCVKHRRRFSGADFGRWFPHSVPSL